MPIPSVDVALVAVTALVGVIPAAIAAAEARRARTRPAVLAVRSAHRRPSRR